RVNGFIDCVEGKQIFDVGVEKIPERRCHNRGSVHCLIPFPDFSKTKEGCALDGAATLGVITQF
ncbi:MAG: hypothetical protein AAFQ57_08680, partial [Cyanobacteria bacterium J06626_14]